MTRSRVARTMWLTAALWLALVPAANAYIDAGSTAVIFQAVVAGLATAGMFLKVFWRRIRGLFSSTTGQPAAPEQPTSDEGAASTVGTTATPEAGSAFAQGDDETR